MLQSRRQDLEAQIRGLREELEKGRGKLQVTHEELLLLRRERREHGLEVAGRAGGGGRGGGGGPSQAGDLDHCLGASWEKTPELGHREP